MSIFKDETQKLKTKVLIFSGVSLFIGITKALPKKLAVIGLDFENSQDVLGWFLFVITLYLLVHFLILAVLDLIKYFQPNIVEYKSKNMTGDIIGFTAKELEEEYNRQNEQYDEELRGSLSDEARDIDRKRKILNENFETKHLNTQNSIEILFNFAVPLVVGIIGLSYLYCFLITLSL